MTPDAGESHYQKIGGEPGVRAVITDFIQRVYKDPIIGFFFVAIDQENLIEREIEFASMHLGGDVKYTGKPLGHAHHFHRINKGHFHRRLWLLEQVLRDHEVDEEVLEHWLQHNRRMEPFITDGSECVAP